MKAEITCPICQEDINNLVQYNGELMCDKCREFMENEDELYEYELEESYKENENEFI